MYDSEEPDEVKSYDAKSAPGDNEENNELESNSKNIEARGLKSGGNQVADGLVGTHENLNDAPSQSRETLAGGDGGKARGTKSSRSKLHSKYSNYTSVNKPLPFNAVRYIAMQLKRA